MDLHPYNTICHDTTHHNTITKHVLVPLSIPPFWMLSRMDNGMGTCFVIMINDIRMMEMMKAKLEEEYEMNDLGKLQCKTVGSNNLITIKERVAK